MNPRAMIAEDEAVLRVQLGEFLERVWPDLDIVASSEDDGVQGWPRSNSSGPT